MLLGEGMMHMDGLDELLLPTNELEFESQLHQGIIQAVTWHALEPAYIQHCVDLRAQRTLTRNKRKILKRINNAEMDELCAANDEAADMLAAKDEAVDILGEMAVLERLRIGDNEETDSSTYDTARAEPNFEIDMGENWENEIDESAPPFMFDMRTLLPHERKKDDVIDDTEDMELAFGSDFMNEAGSLVRQMQQEAERQGEREEEEKVMNPRRIYVTNVNYRVSISTTIR